MRQYRELLFNVGKYKKNIFREFSCDDSLDEFFVGQVEVESYQKLWEVLKLAMVLSHGQSEIERGFSANKDILSSNMQADTLIEYRLVYDAVRKMPEAVEDMTISKSMLESAEWPGAGMLFTLRRQKSQQNQLKVTPLRHSSIPN